MLHCGLAATNCQEGLAEEMMDQAGENFIVSGIELTITHKWGRASPEAESMVD
jgi:hypothetical protein